MSLSLKNSVDMVILEARLLIHGYNQPSLQQTRAKLQAEISKHPGRSIDAVTYGAKLLEILLQERKIRGYIPITSNNFLARATVDFIILQQHDAALMWRRIYGRRRKPTYPRSASK